MSSSFFRIQFNKIVFLILTTLFIGTCSKNEQNDNQINIGFTTSIQSKVFGEEREIMIHLPVGYYDSEESFPVLVMTDGRYHFIEVSTMSDFLQMAKRSPGMIIIGLDGTNRGKDYTPPFVSDSANTNIGGADRFLQYVEEEVIPYIEANYRASHYRLIAGWSFGGLFTFHTMMNRPELFDAYISMSPSLFWDEKQQVAKVIDYLGTNKSQFNSPLFMTMSNEVGDMLEGIEEIADYLASNSITGLRWDYKHYPEESHYSGTFRGMFDGLEFVFRPIAELQSVNKIKTIIESRGFDALETLFDEVSTLYGTKISLDLNTLSSIGSLYLEDEEVDLAILVFKDVIERNPESPWPYYDLGDAYLVAERYQEAVTSFEQAVSKAKVKPSPHFSFFISNLERAKRELEEQSKI